MEEEQEELVEQVVTQWSEAAVEEVMDGEATINVATIGQAAAMDFAAAVRVNGWVNPMPRVHPIRHGEPRLRRPNTVVLHTNHLEGLSVKDVIQAIVNVVGVDVVKAVQSMPYGRYRVTFRINEAKLAFLSQPFIIKDVEIEVQLIENPIMEVKVLYVPSEVPNKVVAEFLGNHGKVETITREMTTEHGFPTIETGTRVAKMTDIKTDIPRKSRIGHFPVEIRHKGQLPQLSPNENSLPFIGPSCE